MNIRGIEDRVLDGTTKGLPGLQGVTPRTVAGKHWNLLDDDLPYPVMILLEPALSHNLNTMAAWSKKNGFLLAPHGKTTMCPQIYKRQLELGAWGITVGNASQAMVCARFGVPRILIANQLVGRANVRSVVGALNDAPALEVYCLLDSVEVAEHLARHAKEAGARRPLRVFLETGRKGWRAGVRSAAEARDVLAAIRRHEGTLDFAGFEGFEGIARPEETSDLEAFLADFQRMADELSRDLPAPKDGWLLSVGGSSYIDYVHDFLTPLRGRFRPVVRSGCTVTSDHGGYARAFERARNRGKGEESYPAFRPALELWSMVQSVRDGSTAILTFGKRDCPYDSELPLPLFRVPPGGKRRDAQPLAGAKVVKLNDQHAYMSFPPDARLQVGDRVACGIIHPCTAFDKWAVIPLVDADDRVVDLYCTYF
jgi:D-serine dehydratase